MEVYITPKEEELLLTLSHDLKLPVHEVTRAALGLLRSVVERYYFTPIQRANMVLSTRPMPVSQPEISQHNKARKSMLQMANEIAG